MTTDIEQNANAVPSDDGAGHEYDREIPSLKKRLNKPFGIALFLCGASLVWLALMNALDENKGKEAETIAEQQNMDYEPAGVPRISLPDPEPYVAQVVPAPGITEKRAVAVAPPAAHADNSEAEARRKREAEIWKRKKQGVVLPFSQASTGGGGYFKTSSGTSGRSDPSFDALSQELFAEGVRLKSELKSMRNRNKRSPVGRAAASRDAGDGRASVSRTKRLADPGFTVVEGKVIGAILETAVQSDAVGKLRAISTEPVYSYNGERLLIPQGSRFIGEYKAAAKHGKTRLFAVWTRAITPDNISINLDSPAIGDLGRAGMRGYIDSHFWERFGASLMLSIIGSAISDSDNNYAQSVGDDFKSSAEIALESSINIPPTFHKHHGESIRIFVAHDINFRDLYEG